jgi:hypothetical protein
MRIDLLSTSRIMFLLLQKHWINSRRDYPFLCTMLVRSQSAPGHAHVARKLLMNYRHKWNQERIDLVGSLMSHVLADDDTQMGK